MASPRVEDLYVLYGSQTGNSEGAALDFCETIQSTYTPEFFEKQKLDPIQVKTTCIQLDDFLEMNHANFTKCIVIFVSSYGVGQAPLGAYRFRDLCDDFLENHKDEPILEGLQYALCGLGDSSYTTYLRNPTTIDKGLATVGGKRIGEMGKANANADLGEDEAQDKVIKRWVQDILTPLAKALCDTKEVDTLAMQSKTIPLLMKLDPDYTPPAGASDNKFSTTIILSILVALIAAIVAMFVMNGGFNELIKNLK